MLPWWRTGNATAIALDIALVFAVGVVVVLAALARATLALMWSLRPQAPRRLLTELGIADAGNGLGTLAPGAFAALISSLLLAALTAVVIFYDAGYRAPIAFNGPLGMNAVVAGRFYGMSNTAFALAAASLLVTIASWSGPLVAAQRRSNESRHAAAVALVAVPGVMALILDAAPEMGADIGGALTLVPTLALLGAGPAAQGGHGPHDQRPGQGQEHHEGENREGGCHGGVGHVGYLSSQNLLARTATRTRSAPTSM